MTKTRPIQSDFGGGEVSPKFLYRQLSDQNLRNCLSKCENFIPTPYGTLLMRSGYKHMFYAVNTAPRLFEHTTPEGDVIVEIGSGKIVAWNENGRIKQNPADDNILVDPVFLEGFLHWTPHKDGTTPVDNFEPTAIPGVGFLCGAGGVPFLGTWDRGAKQEFPISDNSDTYNFSAKLSVTAGGGSTGALGNPLAEFRVLVGSTDGAGDIYDNVFSSPGPLSDGDPAVISGIYVGGLTFAGLNDAYVTMYARRGTDTELTWVDVEVSEISMLSVSSGVEDVEFGSIYTNAELPLLKTAYSPATRELFIFHPNKAPHRLAVSAGGVWSFGPVLNQPAEWAAEGHPRCGTVHEGRLWAGGSFSGRATLWASRIGDYADWALPLPTDSFSPTNPLKFVLASGGAIKWMLGAKNLHVNTDNSEVVGTSEGGVITSNDYKFSVQSPWGSNETQGIQVGREILYVSRDGKKLWAMSDSGTNINGYVSKDVSRYAQHIAAKGVKYSEQLPDPNRLVSFVDNNSGMTHCTYAEEDGQNAWCTSVTLGLVSDIAKLSSPNGSDMWAAVTRTNNSGPSTRIEVLSSSEECFLDAWVEGVVSDNMVSGLGHLSGRDVLAVVEHSNGTNVQRDSLTVSASGEIALGVDVPAESKVYVGLPYVAEAETLPIEGTMPAGTSVIATHSWAEVYVALSNSALPLVNDQLPYERYPDDITDAVPSLKTGLFNVSDTGFGDGALQIKQDVPLRTEITSLMGTLKSSNI